MSNEQREAAWQEYKRENTIPGYDRPSREEFMFGWQRALEIMDRQDERIEAWNAIASHPFFRDCYETEGTLLAAMLVKLSAGPREVEIECHQPGAIRKATVTDWQDSPPTPHSSPVDASGAESDTTGSHRGHRGYRGRTGRQGERVNWDKLMCKIGMHEWCYVRFAYASWRECNRCGRRDHD